MSRRSAEQAEQASRAKSRFLTMMSHELRNPLNGVLGPLALLGQSELAEPPAAAGRPGAAVRPVDAADAERACSTTARCRTASFQLKSEPFRRGRPGGRRPRRAAAPRVRARSRSQLRPGTPERVHGDLDRLRQVFVHLAALRARGPRPARGTVSLRPRRRRISSARSSVADAGETIDWQLDLLMGLSEVAPDQVTAEALRPLIARGLISALGGVLTLVEPADRRADDPGERCRPSPVRFERIRVHLETRSAALATIYQAALRSERVAFVPRGQHRAGRRGAGRQHQRRRGAADVAPARALPRGALRLARPAADARISSTISSKPRTTCRASAPASSAGSPRETALRLPFAICGWHPVSYAESGAQNSTAGYPRLAERMRFAAVVQGYHDCLRSFPRSEFRASSGGPSADASELAMLRHDIDAALQA